MLSTPASICFSRPKEVFVPGFVAGNAGFVRAPCALTGMIKPNWAAAMVPAAIPKKRRRSWSIGWDMAVSLVRVGGILPAPVAACLERARNYPPDHFDFCGRRPVIG